MKKFLRIILASIVLIVLLVLISLAGLHVFLLTERGERLALDTVNSLIPGKISFGSASISLLGQSVELGNAVLAGPDGKTILTTESISAKIDLPALLRKRIVIPTASASGPRLKLVMSPDGKLNIVQAFVDEEEPEEPESDYEVIIERIAVSDGSLGYEDRKQGLLLGLSNLDIQSSLDLSRPSGMLQAAVGNAHIVLDGTPIELDRTEMHASLVEDRLDQIFLETNMGDFRAVLRGSVRDLSNKPLLDVTLDSDGDITGLAAIFEQEKDFTGIVKGRVYLKGTLDNPYSSADIRYSGGRIAGMPVNRGKIAFELSDRILNLHEVSAGMASGTALVKGVIDLKRAFPDGFLLSTPDMDAVSYDLKASADALDLTRIIPDGNDYPKSLSGTLALSGKGVMPPAVSAKAAYALILKGALPDSPVKTDTVTVKGRALLSYPVLDLVATSITTPGMQADLEGSVDLDARTLRSVINLKADKMEKAFAGPLDKLSGSLAAAARISGSFDSPRISASVKGRNVGWEEYLLGDVTVEALLDEKGWVKVAELGVRNNVSTLTADGTMKVFQKGFSLDPKMPLSLNADIKTSNIGQLAEQAYVQGVVEGNAHIEGSLFDPVGTMNVQTTGLKYRDLELGNISLAASMSEGIARIDRLDLINRESALHASGRIHILDTKNRRIMADPEVSLTASGSNIRIEDFGFLAKGLFSVYAKVDGNIKNPQGTVLINGTDLSILEQDIEKVGVYSVFENRQLSIKTLDIGVKADQEITGSGWIGLDGKNQYDFALSSSGIDLASFPFLEAYQVRSGRIMFDLSGRGSMDNPEMSGTVRLNDLSVSNQKFKDISFDLSMNDWKLNMSGQNDFGFRGVYDVKTSDILFQAFFDRMELAPYFAVGGRSDLSGLLSGTTEIRGNTADIEDIDVTLDISNIDIFLGGTNLISASKLALWYRDRQLSIPESRLSLLGRGTMTVRAVTDRSGQLDLAAQGTVPMGVMAVVNPELAGLEGEVRFRMAAQGPVMKPVISGEMDLSNVQYILSYNDQSLHSINGHITITPDQVTLENLAGQLDTGYFTASGTIGLKDLKPVRIDLTVKARSLPVTIPDTMDLLIETNLSLTGTPDDTLLQGNITILDGLYYKDLQLNLIAEVGERVTGGRRAAAGTRTPIQTPFLRNLALDLTVSRRGSVLIENNLAELTIIPDLQVVGTLNNPIITGRVSVTEGTVTYQKRSFKVTRGVIDFSNPYRTEAEVDLRAEGRIREWNIIITVTETLDNLKIELSSNPPAENAVILSLLATGRTPDEISGGTGATQRSPSSMLAEVLANTYGERVKETAGIDILEFEAKAPEQGQQGDDIKITVGEELTRRLTVKYSIETENNEVTQAAIAEFKFFENLLIDGFQNNKGGFGGDIQFRAEFR